MAQRTENEEAEFKVVPESITLCVSCNVAGNCSANNLCSKCLPSSSSTTTSSGSISPKVKAFRSSLSIRSSPERKFVPVNDVSSDLMVEVVEPVKRVVNRCSGCRRKVGLTGFRCRCGELFCAEHRYSDRHECSYDYKAAGREAIARENPMVKAAKIVRI